VRESTGRASSQGRAGLPKALAFKLTTLATDAGDGLVCNKVAGLAYCDPDGLGAAAAVLIAQFTTVKPTLTNADFVVI